MAKKKHYTHADPFAEREANRYEKPIPSREYILDKLLEESKALPQKKIAKKFGLKDPEQLEALERRLNAMVRDCQIAQTPKGFTALTMFKEEVGELSIEKDGFGLVYGEDDTIRLPPREIRGFFEGDILRVRIVRFDYEGQAFGEVIECEEMAEVELLGRFYQEYGQHYVMPLGKRYSQDIHIDRKKTMRALEGDIVQVYIDREHSTHQNFKGEVVHVLGDPEREGIEIEVATLKFHLPHFFEEKTLKEAKKFGKTIPNNTRDDRVDITDLPLVTIDGEDAKDFDDAVFCEPKKSGWRLVVAIADVSHYVKPGSSLDEEAEERGNSVYFPGHVIPMLPETLSNGLCSLKPDEKRLALVCDMLITGEGEIKRSQFYPAVMKSHARLTYTHVSKILEGTTKLQKKYEFLSPHLNHLHDLFKTLVKARALRGAIEFSSVDTQIMFDEAGKIASIIPRERTVAHQIIEECMLAANVTAAKLLKRHRMPTLYRVHESPPQEKLSALRDFLKELGLSLPGGDDPTPKDFSSLIADIQGREDAHVIETVMLRSMSQAEYATSQDGHFGLAYSSYLHFTSPIRRYPDLIVHRQIKQILNKKRVDKKALLEDLDELGAHCSMTERRADEATRDATMALKCHYMADKVGETFTARVTGVTAFGLFVELDAYYVEGLVHVATLGDDYYYYEPFKHRMIGERTRQIYQLGDKLEVQLMRVNVEDKKIDLEIVKAYSEKTGKAARPKGAKDKKRTKRGGRGKSKRRTGKRSQ